MQPKKLTLAFLDNKARRRIKRLIITGIKQARVKRIEDNL